MEWIIIGEWIWDVVCYTFICCILASTVFYILQNVSQSRIPSEACRVRPLKASTRKALYRRRRALQRRERLQTNKKVATKDESCKTISDKNKGVTRLKRETRGLTYITGTRRKDIPTAQNNLAAVTNDTRARIHYSAVSAHFESAASIVNTDLTSTVSRLTRREQAKRSTNVTTVDDVNKRGNPFRGDLPSDSTAFEKMSSEIDELIKKAKGAIAEKDDKAAREYVLKAVKGADNAKKGFLFGLDQSVTEENLENWFGECAVIFNKIGDNFSATRWFYTATVFPVNWTQEQHREVSKVLWDEVIYNQPLLMVIDGYKNICGLLAQLEGLAKLVVKRQKWNVGMVITDDILRIHVFMQRHPFLSICPGSNAIDRRQAVSSLMKLMAKCALGLGNVQLVKSLCNNIIKEAYNDAEALELWGRALHKTGEFEKALDKCELAAKYTTDEDDQLRLAQLIVDIKAEIVVPVETLEPDIEWLPERTQARHMGESKTAKRGSEEDKGKKKRTRRHSYAKTSEHHQVSPSPSSSPRPACTIPKNKGTNGLYAETSEHKSEKTTERPTNINANNSAIRKLQLEHAGVERSRNSSMCSNTSSYMSHEIPFSDIDSDTDETDGFNDSSSIRSDQSSPDEPDEESDETSFYEQSCRHFSDNYQSNALETEVTDENLLKYGLKLSKHYLHQFEDKPKVYQRQAFYDEFMKTDELKERLLKNPGVFKKCVIQVESPHLSYCTPIDSKDKICMIEISGRSKAGQAFNEDEVVVEVLDKEHDNSDKRYGRVLGVLNRKHHKDIANPVFICTLDNVESHNVRPMCKTVPKIYIMNYEIMKHHKKFKRYKVEIYDYDERTGTLDNPRVVDVNPGDREKYVFMVAFIKWSPLHVYPFGAVIKMLPCGSTINRGLMILNLQHNAPSLYKQSTIKAVESMTLRQGDEPNDTVLEGRADLTGLNTFTIDPPGSRDLDDALSIEKHGEGYKVGVHIADVAAYVTKDNPVDGEAKERAVTFYPGIRKPRHMLPEPLSSNHCSILPNKRRMTLSVLFYLDSQGKLMQMQGSNPEIQRSVIRSRRQFTYRKVQDIIEEEQHSSDQMSVDIKRLFKLADARRKERLGNSMYALDLENDEDESEDSLSETLKAHYLVEEFMILANWKVAQALVRKYPHCVPLRCQPPPTKESMEHFVQKHGCFIDTLVALQDRQISDFKKPSFDMLLQEKSDKTVIIPRRLWEIIFTRSSSDAEKLIKTDNLHPLQHLVLQHWLSIQERAKYKCSGSLSGKDDGQHYGLSSCSHYTHFTSPIRRYNDLVVHRLLHAFLDGKASPYSKGDIEDICIHVNSRMKRAKDYQKGCKALQQAIKFKSCPQIINCFVDDVSDRGVSLCSPAFRHVAKRHRELSFNLLDMSFKPDVVKDTVTNHDIVTATWRKRLYDSKGTSSNPPDRGNTQTLNPHHGVVFIRLREWAWILKYAVDRRFDDMNKAIKNADVTQHGKGSDDVSTECYDPMKIQPNTKFSLSFTHGQTLKVQMSAEPQKGMLAPRPVLYNMTNNSKCCLQHTDDPVLHLSHYTTRPTCDQYKTVKQYQERWIPLILMEAATGAVRNEETFIINSLLVKFTEERQGKFSLPLAYCEVRNIEFSGTVSEDDDDDNDSSGLAYDWLCIKCDIPHQTPHNQESAKVLLAHDTVWVGHAAVTSVKKRKGDKDEQGKITVAFILHGRSPNVPLEVRQTKQSRFSVEVLTKSEVDRRTESYMKQLPAATDLLAEKIALNVTIPKLDKDHAKIAARMQRDFFIEPSEGSHFNHPLPRNNYKQQEAIDKALKSRFSLIQGPPGTGKTYTGIKLIYLFNDINEKLSKGGNPRKQVLFCGPSNKSVDLVARWMLGRLGMLCPKIVRVYGRSIEAMDFPIPGRTFISKRSTRSLKADDEIRPVALHHLIRQKGNTHAEEINAYDRKFKATNYAPQPDIVKKYIHMVREASIEEIRKYDVILCTTAVGSNPKVLKATNVHQVIVDESGMCPEPQCLVPIIATKAEQVVLIGDHKQLRPIIMCKEAAELGLDISLFERYALSESSKNVEFTMLDTQYRMNPQLCRFPSNQFYDGELKTASGAWCRDSVLDIWPKDRTGKSYPHILVHVEGEEKVLTVSTEDGNEQSKSNTAEVEYAIKVFRYLIDEGVPAGLINVVSQYNAQCSELKRSLETEGFSNFTVSTVVSSQGGEWDYVIFSTVRSLPDYKIEKNPTLGWCKQNLGFITDKNQINVALTRARKGLIIIGNRNLLQCDVIWKRLVGHYESRGCIKTPAQFPPPPKTRRQKMMEAQLRTEERFGDEKYIPGEATSFQGSFDDEWETNRRGNRRYQARRQNQQ